MVLKVLCAVLFILNRGASLDRTRRDPCDDRESCQGPRGPPGEPGIPGRVGEDGRDGRDALGGAVYVRWGKTVCPSHSELVYRGVAGGSYYNRGGSSNYLCMPEEPIYDRPQASRTYGRGFVYGAEYEVYGFPLWRNLHNHDVPCAVCLATSRPSLLMIPARNVCPGGWVKEYSGYLMTGRHDYQRTEMVCMDRYPQKVWGTSHNADGALFFLVEGSCRSDGNGLPCGPYIDGYELTCAVCTK